MCKLCIYFFRLKTKALVVVTSEFTVQYKATTVPAALIVSGSGVRFQNKEIALAVLSLEISNNGGGYCKQ